MDISLNKDTAVLIKGILGAEFETTLSKIVRSRGDSVRHFIEVDASTLDSAIKHYHDDELRAEMAELTRRIRDINRILNECDG